MGSRGETLINDLPKPGDEKFREKDGAGEVKRCYLRGVVSTGAPRAMADSLSLQWDCSRLCYFRVAAGMVVECSRLCRTTRQISTSPSNTLQLSRLRFPTASNL